MKIFKNICIVIATLFSSLVSAQDNAKFTSQTNDEFKKLIADKAVQLLDVRTADEYKQGHIPGAENVDLNSNEFLNRLRSLDSNKPVAVYCRSGARSKAAATKLAAKGFKVYELDKGFMNWDGEKSAAQ